MRIPSAKTDQVIYFVAVDSTDFVTRKTGLSAFTVYRSRNGGTATVYTTPTIAELSSANMPGVYSFLIDEDTTVASTSDSEEYCVHITCATMAPVTRTIELYRRDTTSGNSALVDANGRVDVIKVAGTTQTARDLGGQLDAAISTRLASASYTAPLNLSAAATASAVWQDTTAGDFTTALSIGKSVMNGVALGTGLTVANLTNLPNIPANWLTAAGINAGALNGKGDWLLASSYTAPNNLSAATIGAAAWDIVLSGHLTAGTTGAALNGASAPSAATVAAAVWDEVVTGHGTASSFGLLVKTDLDATVSSRLASTSYTAPDNADIVAIKAKTDNLPTAPADETLIIAATNSLASSIAALPTTTTVNAIKSKTDNLPASPAAVSDIPTPNTNADALLDRANGIETGYTPRQAMRIMSAVLGGKSSGHPGSPVYRNLPDTADRVTATVSSGNRSAVTLNP